MKQSLVEHLMVELPPDPGNLGNPQYSESHHYNLDESGQPAVETGSAAEVRTVTRVEKEADDFESSAYVRTITEVKSEADDFDSLPISGGTQAKAINQTVSAARLKTKTFVAQENDDWSSF